MAHEWMSWGQRRGLVMVTQQRNGHVVRFGMTVVMKTDEGIESFVIADEWDAKPSEGVISSRSPLARALIGRRPGETVEVLAPRGHRYAVKILSMW